jgi:hypothetical protein
MSIQIMVHGKSGKGYLFHAYPIDEKFHELNKVFIVTNRQPPTIDTDETIHYLLHTGYYDNDNQMPNLNDLAANGGTHIAYFEPASQQMVDEILTDIKDGNEILEVQNP